MFILICSNCQTYYVRDPCPNCGRNNYEEDKKQSDENLEDTTVRPSQVREREAETGSQVLMQQEDEESLVKPSQRYKQEHVEDQEIPSFQRFRQEEEDDEELVKPSDKIKEQQPDEDIPSFQRFDRREEQEKKKEKSNMDQKNDDIPSFQRYQQEDEVDVSTFSTKLNRPDQQEKLKNDVEYRNKVKETLEEVMGLLEKLIDDE